MSITLHPRLGINCRMTICPRCGDTGDELVLLGQSNYVSDCPSCKCHIFGGLRSLDKCPKCGERGPGVNQRTLTDEERLPSSHPCQKCQTEIDEHRKLVEEGGVYFKCKSCNQTGVIRPGSDLAKRVREVSKIEAPKPVGFEFDTCDQHTVKESKDA